MDRQLNNTIKLVHPTNEDELPAVQIGDVLVFVYVDEDGTLHVTVDTEDQAGPVAVEFNINGGTVFDETVD